ncbi:hypothetical protein RFI_40283 [Reticulomyxa filosa]|uniref:Uncharacterized protein n=1 Tax=Reticulomyxa filosa TaxID=46433 RepID=X6L7G2_RETFI|nr:hypothetical protein RFI_40283 [Reticulomyxa filosa]|eukprot:ETN97248.1 hypothetical protein RFI_40283 [Reticulomyxa filosa]
MLRIPATTIIQGQNVSIITMVTRSNEFGILENINYIMALKKNCPSSIADGLDLGGVRLRTNTNLSKKKEKKKKKDVIISLKMETISIIAVLQQQQRLDW